MTNLIECSVHGESESTYVCCHLKKTLDDKTLRGFNMMRDEDGEVQAFCNKCWNASDEEWDALNASGPRLLCFGCLMKIADMNNIQIDADA
ncbi:MAG: hypothetical protein AAF204_03175 [Pseudomonadota bacterium]